MKIESIMHLAFYTDRMDEMIRFYTEVLPGKVKVLTRYKAYLDRDDRPLQQQIARKDPEAIFNVYVELCPGQFLELFPKREGQTQDLVSDSHLGYAHFALLTDDIEAFRRQMEEKGVKADTDISKGPSGTYQLWYHDPDGNRFEVMQFTKDSYQVKGHID